jgi:hypothetical protein
MVEEDVRVEDGCVNEDEARDESSGNRNRVPVTVREPEGRLDCGSETCIPPEREADNEC